MAVYTGEYTIEEQIVTQIARAFGPDDEMSITGMTMCGYVGAVLAQRLYAPKCVVFTEVAARGATTSGLRFPFMAGHPPEDSLEALATSRDVFDFVIGGKWCIMMQPAQIDMHGNMNISLIGDKKKPTAVLVAARGVPDNTNNAKNVIYTVTDHTKRSFVEKVDFVSGIGYGDTRNQGLVK